MHGTFETSDDEICGFELVRWYFLIYEAVAVHREAVAVIGKGDAQCGMRSGPVVAVCAGAVGSPVVRCVQLVGAVVAVAAHLYVGLHTLLVESVAETVGWNKCAIVCVGVDGESDFDSKGHATGYGEREFVGCSEQCVALYATRRLAASLCSSRPRMLGMDGGGETGRIALLDNPVGIVAVHP